MTTPFADHFSGHAPDYRTYRPSYPPELFAYLKSVVPNATQVWDCGTGNGQAAVAVAEHFPAVFATDPSVEQISQAEPQPNITYAIAPAEKCPLPDGSVDLVTVAQALHWFNFDEFYAEVKRVFKPGGVIAVWGYYHSRVNERVDGVLSTFTAQIINYWPGEREFVEKGYATIPFPFVELPAAEFTMTSQWTLTETLGYLNTWSATKRFIAKHGFDPIERLTPAFAAAWGDPSQRRTVSWDLFLRVGRVN